MNCPMCGVAAPEDALYCHKCGQPLEAGVAGEDREASAAKRFVEAAAEARREAEGDPNELLWRGTYSPRAMIGTWIGTGLLTIVALALAGVWLRGLNGWMVLAGVIVVVWLGQLAVLAYRRLSVSYQLTRQRFVHESGLLRRVTDRLEVLDIDDITVEQGLVERFTGVGTIRIRSSDRTHPELRLVGIDDVRRVSSVFDDTRLAERRRRGLHIEQI